MKRRYVIVFGAVLAATIAITLIGRAPRKAPETRTAAAALPAADLTITLGADGLNPQHAQVPKDHAISLTVRNETQSDANLELSGYTDHVSVVVRARDVWHGQFVSDRPGDDFAWLVDGQPMGRLHVTGSHLMEGHR